MPIVFGTATVSGTVIWLAPYTQTSTEQGGKGGPEQQTYSYNQSIAIGLCESPRDGDQAIHGLSRVWENGTIVYDIRPQQPADTATGQAAETDTEYANRLTASAIYAETFTLYFGTEVQTADPTIEAVEGFGHVPAFRGLAYVMYPNRLLQTAQGWRHPNFQFEVYQSGKSGCTDLTHYSADFVPAWLTGAGEPMNSLGVYTYTINQIDNTPYGSTSGEPPFGNVYSSLIDALTAANTYRSCYTQYLGYGIESANATLDASGGPTVVSGPAPAPNNVPDPPNVILAYSWRTAKDGLFDQAHVQPNPNDGPSLFAVPGSVFWEGGQLYATTNIPDSDSSAYPDVLWTTPYTHGSRWDRFYWFQQLIDLQISVARQPGPPPPPCNGLIPSVQYPGYAINSEGQLIKCTDWVKDTTQGYNWLQAYSPNNVGGDSLHYPIKYPLNPCVPQSSAEAYDEAFWTTAYNAAVAAGKMAPGLTYLTNYPNAMSYGWTNDLEVCDGAGSQVSVAEIILAVSERAGLTAIDVSDMEPITLHGYSISSLSSAKDIIDPLRSIAFFDAVESGPTLRFQSRGKPIVATLTRDDFGCYDDGANDGSSASSVPAALTVARADQTTLPRSIRFHYKSVTRDYQDAEQDSPYRLLTQSVNDQDISIPMCLGDTQALQSAEILWADAWAGMTTYTLSVDQSLWAIEPGDSIGVPVDNVIQRMRVISDANSSGILRKLTLVSDDSGAYISYALAEESQVQPQKLTIIAPTSAELLDLPALQDADSDPGFYVAAQRVGAGNTWKGCVVYKSIDGGSTYSTLFSLATEAAIGTLAVALTPSEYFTWDDATQILVNVISSAVSFESRTDDAVLSGANAAAIGSDGRWEIVQFANADQISSTQWRLTRLLRGRRGTEHNIPSSRFGDTLVMISTGDLGRVMLNSTEIGALRDYRATSIGSSFSSGAVYPFTGRAMALTPFSPVDPIAATQLNADILLSWTRRDRLGGTLMSGVDMPLSESSLSFQIDIFDASSPPSPEIVVRTLTTSTTSVTYSLADQQADFPTALPITLKVAIYQMSAVVGRGIPCIETIAIERATATTIALRQEKHVGISGGSIPYVTAIFDEPVLAGSLIHVIGTCSGTTMNSVVDNHSNPYTAISDSAATVRQWYGVVDSTSELSVQLNFNSTSSNPTLTVREIVGAKLSGPFVANSESSVTSTGATDGIASPSITNIAAHALISALTRDSSGSSAAATAGTGFTQDIYNQAPFGVTTEHQRVAAGSVAATFTSTTEDIFEVVVAIFAEV